ncbi:DUF5658 family protein [Desulfosporosinus sp. SB140]|uniref:DUF5658 family protein n=1 Tax=Desulfosporosinus paludis TaxID=3115649 RepID=UPI00388F4E7D
MDWRATPLKKEYKLLLLFCILNALDYLTTTFAISQGAGEGNLIPSYFVSHNALHYYKFGGVAFLSMLLIYLARKNMPIVIKVFLATNFFRIRVLSKSLCI